MESSSIHSFIHSFTELTWSGTFHVENVERADDMTSHSSQVTIDLAYAVFFLSLFVRRDTQIYRVFFFKAKNW